MLSWRSGEWAGEALVVWIVKVSLFRFEVFEIDLLNFLTFQCLEKIDEPLVGGVGITVEFDSRFFASSCGSGLVTPKPYFKLWEGSDVWVRVESFSSSGADVDEDRGFFVCADKHGRKHRDGFVVGSWHFRQAYGETVVNAVGVFGR